MTDKTYRLEARLTLDAEEKEGKALITLFFED